MGRMPDLLDPSAPEDMPPMTVEMDAIRLLVEAYIEAEGPKKGRRLLLAASRIMNLREQKAELVVEFLPPAEAMARDRVRRQTRAWFRRSLPVWLSRLDDA